MVLKMLATMLTQPQKNIGANFYSIDIIMTVEIEGTMWDTRIFLTAHIYIPTTPSVICATVLKKISVKPKWTATKVLSGIFLVGI